MSFEVAIALLGLFLFVLFFALMAALFRRNLDVTGRIQVGRPAGQTVRSWINYVRSIEGLFKPLGEFIPRTAEEMSRQEKRLVQAGIRRKDAVVLFHGAQFGLALLFVAASLTLLPSARYT